MLTNDTVAKETIAKLVEFCYNDYVMEKRVNLYVSRKNMLTWLMALCLVGSAVARIVITGVKGIGYTQEVWSQIVLPVVATLLFVLVTFISGKEMFHKTAIPVWLMGLYFAIRPHLYISANPFVMGMYYTCIIFMCLLYTTITAGRWYPWLLVFLFAAPLAAMGYFCSVAVGSGLEVYVFLMFLPDILLFIGCFLLVFAIRAYTDGVYHPTWGDRKDGRRIRTLPPMSQVSPYIMVSRNESSIYFEESFEITHIDRYIRQKRREGYTSFGIMHVMLAAYCRTMCKFPALNRFLSGQRVYSRGEDIQFCLTVKKEMTVSSPDTVIKVHLSPRDTAIDVYNKLQTAVEEAKNTPLDSGMDNTAGVLSMVPGVVLKFLLWLLKLLDYFGLLPGFLLEISPFHGSVFFTSMGSLGIPPVYHHLYNFGNLPIFGAFGCKRRNLEILEDGSIVQRKYVDCKFVMDERIVDGFYYAAFFKHYKRVLAHPELLDDPPAEVLKDID